MLRFFTLAQRRPGLAERRLFKEDADAMHKVFAVLAMPASALLVWRKKTLVSARRLWWHAPAEWQICRTYWPNMGRACASVNSMRHGQSMQPIARLRVNRIA